VNADISAVGGGTTTASMMAPRRPTVELLAFQ
jgi:hypothetical protein